MSPVRLFLFAFIDCFAQEFHGALFDAGDIAQRLL